MFISFLIILVGLMFCFCLVIFFRSCFIFFCLLICKSFFVKFLAAVVVGVLYFRFNMYFFSFGGSVRYVLLVLYFGFFRYNFLKILKIFWWVLFLNLNFCSRYFFFFFINYVISRVFFRIDVFL